MKKPGRLRVQPESGKSVSRSAIGHGAGSSPATLIRKAGRLALQEPVIQSSAVPPDCPCGGVMAHGMWVHKARCQRTVILYYAHGHKADDWSSPIYQCCRFHCPGTIGSMGIFHSWDCAFWDSLEWNPKGAVPFGLE